MNKDVELSIRQMAESWRLVCTFHPGHTLAASDGVEYLFSGLPISFFNVALLTQYSVSSEALKSYGHDACAWASDKGVPWLLVVTHETLEAGVDASAVLDGCGLVPAMPLTGMHAQQVSPVSSIPEGLELILPQDAAGYLAMLDINSAADGMDLEACKDLLGKRSFWKDHFPVLGLAGDKPVCSAAVLMVDGYRYVVMVATHPEHQRRGYASAAMRHALDVSARVHGERPTVLHASDAGRPVYERMGYTTIATHTLFMEKKFLISH